MGIGIAIAELRDRLKPVKELIAIIVFFVGGVVFAISYFVTREAFEYELEKINGELVASNIRMTEEIASLQCKLISHVSILSFHDSSNKILYLKPPIIHNIADIELKIRNGNATKKDIVALKELEDTLNQYDRELLDQKAKRDAAWEKMVARGC